MDNYTFKGKKVDMRPHYLDDDTWELVKHGTRDILFIGTKQQIMEKYDEINNNSNS